MTNAEPFKAMLANWAQEEALLVDADWVLSTVIPNLPDDLSTTSPASAHCALIAAHAASWKGPNSAWSGQDWHPAAWGLRSRVASAPANAVSASSHHRLFYREDHVWPVEVLAADGDERWVRILRYPEKDSTTAVATPVAVSRFYVVGQSNDEGGLMPCRSVANLLGVNP